MGDEPNEDNEYLYSVVERKGLDWIALSGIEASSDGSAIRFFTDSERNLQTWFRNGMYASWESEYGLKVGEILADDAFVLRIRKAHFQLAPWSRPQEHIFSVKGSIPPESIDILVPNKCWSHLTSKEAEVLAREARVNVVVTYVEREAIVDHMLEEFKRCKGEPAKSELSGFFAFDGCGIKDGDD